MGRKVIKIGGSSILNDVAFNNLIKLIDIGSGNVFVFSAFATTTRNLHKSALAALNGNLGESRRILDQIFDFHLRLSPGSQTRLMQKLDEQRESLFLLMKGIEITRDLSNRTLDLILSAGESLAGLLISHEIEELSLNAIFTDASKVFVTDNNHGKAKPQYEISKNNFSVYFNVLENKNIAIAGYIALGENGEITTMGYESSNLSAALIADFINAESLTIKTNVDGIRSADPAIIPGSTLISGLNYYQALFAARAGLKLIYPEMIKILEKKNIPAFIENFASKGYEQTVISEKFAGNSPIVITNHALTLEGYPYPDKLSTEYRDALISGYNSGKISFFSMPDYEPKDKYLPGFGLVNVVFLDKDQIGKVLKIAAKQGFSYISSSEEAGFVSVTLPLTETNNLAQMIHKVISEN